MHVQSTQRGRASPSQRRSPKVSGPALVQPSSEDVDESIAFLALSGIKGVGYWTLFKLRQKSPSFAAILNEGSEARVRALLRAAGAQLDGAGQVKWHLARAAILKRAREVHDKLKCMGAQIIHRGLPGYPLALHDLPDAPYWLFVQGNVKVLHKPALTIVGTRNPTSDGLWLTQFVGGCLHQLKCPTVSGLAAGIDQVIHRASLRAGVPTVAVLGNGIFNDYPKGSEQLRAEIVAKGGAVVSEYLPNQGSSAENFVRRNRLQAALGCALVPTEWAVKSGTARTVKYSADLGRPIACLRMPDWDEARVPFEAVSSESKALFTMPGDEQKFRQFLRKALRSGKSRTGSQPDLFNGK